MSHTGAPRNRARFAAIVSTAFLMAASADAQEPPLLPAPVTAETINAAPLDASALPATPLSAEPPVIADGWAKPLSRLAKPNPSIVRLQVLLDRAGASPGVIDGFDGDNVRKAVVAFEMMQGLPADGVIDPEMLARIATPEPIVGLYTISPDDLSAIVAPLPTDYSQLAKRDFLGYTSVEEELAERFHMDVKLLKALNPDAAYRAGERIFVTAPGASREGKVANIQADKALRQVRAYDAAGVLLAAYPATIGSEDNPSPSGTHVVQGVSRNPTYTYNPKINFQQGDNKKILNLPPGPNGPVGSVWIDLSEPTYGIHGTPEPSLIDKTGSHGCVRLTNWDAQELAGMVKPGIEVEFMS
jgi:lipoprotein-anchoring transpeptidase ErfK/SrfK